MLPRGLVGIVAGLLATPRGALLLMRQPRLRRLAWWPLLLTALAYVALMVLVVLYAGDVLSWLWARPENLWMAGLWWVAVALAGAVLLVLAGACFVTVVGIVAGPFYERLAQRVLESHGRSCVSPSLVDGFTSVLVRLGIFGLPATAVLLIGLVVTALSPVAVPLAGAWVWLGLGLETAEPALALAGYSLRRRLCSVWRCLPLMLGAGAVQGLAFLVPLLPLLTLPAGVAGMAQLVAAGGFEGENDRNNNAP